MKIAISILFIFVLMACNSNAIDTNNNEVKQEGKELDYAQNMDKYKTAYFASGCFWCVEAIFQSVDGVIDAISGYSGGEKESPTYQEVSRGETKHAEAVKVIYDPTKVDFETLVVVFFGSHDPTTLNRQGPDRGAQYRSIAFYNDNFEKEAIDNYIKKLEELNTYDSEIVTEVKAFEKFYDAEDYHQEYESNHPENPYVQSVSIPRLRAFQKKYPDLLKESAKH